MLCMIVDFAYLFSLFSQMKFYRGWNTIYFSMCNRAYAIGVGLSILHPRDLCENSPDWRLAVQLEVHKSYRYSRSVGQHLG